MGLPWGLSPESEDWILPRGPKSPMSDVHTQSSPGSQKSPQSEVPPPLRAIPHERGPNPPQRAKIPHERGPYPILPREPTITSERGPHPIWAYTHGNHSNQLWMGQNIDWSNWDCESMGKSVTCIGSTSSLTKFIEIDHNCHTTLQGTVDW